MKNKLMILTVFVCLLILGVMGCSKDKNCMEVVDPNCFCTMQYEPVCGCNNKTYGNPCAASCAGITEYTQGECN